MEQILRKIVDHSISEFQDKSVHAGKESLMWIVDWYRKLLEFTEYEDLPLVARKKRMLSTLEIIQRELRILTAHVDKTINSIKNNR